MKSNATRRQFIKNSSSLMAAPYFAPAAALGLGKTVAPSDRIVMGAIGCGGKGNDNTRRFLNDERVQVVAACDVDSAHLATTTQKVNQHYKTNDCQGFEDFRDLLQVKGLDAVHVSTPDHWHAVAAVHAMRQCKDVYCEKPLANSFGESRAIRNTAQSTGRILQCGSHERSNHNCRFAAELVRNGRIGKLHTIRIQMPCEQPHHLTAKGTAGPLQSPPVPSSLNWDFWQGHTQPVDYAPQRCHFWWRFILNYGGGEMTDRGAHIIDIAQLALGMDSSGPIKFQANGKQVKNSPYDAFWDYEFTNTYENGVQMIGTTEGPRGLKFEGSDGWLFVAIHGGALSASNPDILPQKIRAGGKVGINDPIPDDFQVRLGRSPGHHRNFIDSVLNRKPPMATAEIGHRTATICHLNNMAMKLGRPIHWTPQREAVINDREAGQLLIPPMRAPWTV
ncbi:MAG: Gfo/Idh/MocA family oxidoreductase [Planctomycetaceae bacterium]|nr:Gfo/Idh/MocA family oxidoreductase [Planctomycetaceae bacterium]